MVPLLRSAMSQPSRSLRVPFVRIVQVRPVGSVVEPKRLCVSDLSRGGMFIRMPEPYKAGTRLAVSFEVRGQTLPFCEIEVAWQRQRRDAISRNSFPGFGAKFTVLAPKARALVDHLVFLCSPHQKPQGPRKQYNVPPGLKSRRGGKSS